MNLNRNNRHYDDIFIENFINYHCGLLDKFESNDITKIYLLFIKSTNFYFKNTYFPSTMLDP